ILKGNFASVAGNWKQASTNDIIHISTSATNYTLTGKTHPSYIMESRKSNGYKAYFTSGTYQGSRGEQYTSTYNTATLSNGTYYVSGLLDQLAPAQLGMTIVDHSYVFIPKGVVGVPGSDASKDRIVMYTDTPTTALLNKANVKNVFYKQ
ncbi:hypothetical protein, partial [Lactococcus nasutitermitis]